MSMGTLTILSVLVVANGVAPQWELQPGVNAVPSTAVGVLAGTMSSAAACRAGCEANGTACTIYTWNSKSGHCFWRFDGIWAPMKDSDRVESGCILAPVVPGCRAAPTPAPTPPFPSAPLPQLFMDLLDIEAPRGRLTPRATSARIMPSLAPPPLNYSGGDTVFAAFDLGGGAYEVFAAVGRPGEPISSATATAAAAGSTLDKNIAGPMGPSPTPPPADGVSVLRFTSSDLKTYSAPIVVLFLENGSGSDANDGAIWTVKSMDRDAPAGAPSAGATYLLFASYGSGPHTFMSDDIETANSLTPTTGDLKTPNFKDHDDTNVIYHHESKRWIDMQIMYEKWNKTYCDNVKGARRVITARDSRDGKTWSDDFGCLDAPQKDEHCTTFNTSAMVRPGDFRSPNDPEEMEFYRIRPFTLGASGRLAAHVLLYVPSPSDVVTLPGYGRQPLWYCKNGCCHGPHMYEEWWLGPPSGDPSDIPGWRRPFASQETRAFPHDIWAMAQPLFHPASSALVWVDNGHVWGVPENRLAGLQTQSNSEFSTKLFEMPPAPKSSLWVEADVRWGQKAAPFGDMDWCVGGCNGVGGSDEAHAAYLLVSMHDASGAVIPGFERSQCAFTNVSGRLPLRWAANASSSSAVAATGASLAGTRVSLRFYFRDATVFAVGASPK